MEISVYNIKGEDTGRKVVLNDDVFAIEPNDHAIYLDANHYTPPLFSFSLRVFSLVYSFGRH